MKPSPYSFRPAAHADLPLLERWLRTPEVVRWWGDPAEQLELLRGDLAEPRAAMRIVSFGQRPFAYAQHYDVHTWPQLHFAKLPPGSRAIDAFIGEPDMLARGHGAQFLKLLAEHLMHEGAPLVAIDPSVDNARARRAYEKAGFRCESVVDTAEGPAVLMIFAATSP